MVSEFRGPEDALEPLGGPKVSKSITFQIETYRNFVPSRTSGFACQMHFFVVDTIHAIDSRSVEQYSAVKISLDVSYCRVFCWDNPSRGRRAKRAGPRMPVRARAGAHEYSIRAQTRQKNTTASRRPPTCSTRPRNAAQGPK